MYHLTSHQYISNHGPQQTPMQPAYGNFSQHQVMKQNNNACLYHDTCSHTNYGHHYQKVHPQRTQIQTQCRTHAFSEIQQEQPLYEACSSISMQHACDQPECVHHAISSAHNCCNSNHMISRAASCTMDTMNAAGINTMNAMNVNANTKHITQPTNYWATQPTNHIKFTTQAAAQFTSEHDHYDVVDYGQTKTGCNHPNIAHCNTNHEQLSECIDNSIYSAGYIVNSPVITPVTSSNGTTPSELSPRCGFNTFADSINSHSPELSFGESINCHSHSPMVQKRGIANIATKYSVFAKACGAPVNVANHPLKSEHFPTLSLPRLKSSDATLITTIATQKDLKSNRGRKKIDRSEFLNVDGRYQCKLCPKSYKRYNDLKGHYAVHSDDTECCPHCQKKFSRPIYLRDHIRTHTGEKPFNCDICHKQFAAKRNLVQHRKRHFRANSRLIGRQGE